MGWLDDLVDVGKQVVGFVKDNSSVVGSVVKTVATGYALHKISKSVKKQNAAANPIQSPPQPDFGVRLQLDAETTTKIPVVYGRAIIGGKLVDAQMVNNNQTMWYAMVLSEVTGSVNIGQGAPSVFTFKDIYWNNNRIIFKADGITVDYTVDKNGKIDRTLSNFVKIYTYNNGSESPVWVENYTAGTSVNAYTLMPGWTSSYTMNELVFVLVQVTYNKERNITGIGQMQFDIANSMEKPGDCLYDYMTNTRYGAGIPATEIKGT